jgi:hypothetical protein
VDNAVALVQTYLRVNGYFTVTEYPVIATRAKGEYRTATDLDVLAFRFPHAGRLVPGKSADRDENPFSVDDALQTSTEHADMLIGEVKEGRAQLNEAASDPAVLRAVLAGFGCCSREDAPRIAGELLRAGQALLPSGHRIRMTICASIANGDDRPRQLVITLGHVVRFLRAYIDAHREVLRHSDTKDPAFGFLMTLAKAERGMTP